VDLKDHSLKKTKKTLIFLPPSSIEESESNKGQIGASPLRAKLYSRASI